MCEFIIFFARMLVLMLLVAFLPVVFDLPDAIAKYFGSRLRRSNAGPPPHGLDEEAARVLGGSRRRGEVSSEAGGRVPAASWRAGARNGRSPAQLVPGLRGGASLVDET